jgi:AcrR family transcriptional regulator
MSTYIVEVSSAASNTGTPKRKNGPVQLSTRSASARTSLGSTTYHFGSRDDLVREAFLWYLQYATAELARLRHDQRTNTATSRLVEFVVSLVRQESHNQPLVRAEYELIMFAGRDPALREELRNWELAQRRHLADELRAAGSRRPDAGAATLVALIRGLELELLTHAPLTAAQLRGRVQPVVLALV